MTGDPDVEQLSRLRAHLNRSLVTYLHRTNLLSPVGGNRRDVTRASGVVSEVSQLPATRPSGQGAHGTSVNVHLNGGTIVLDDERRVRALAKEIKRLIIEDIRRGIGF